MADKPDYGYSQIDWEQTNPENVKLVEAEYRQRFEEALKAWQDIDKKGQFILTGLTGLLTAILGLMFSQAKNLELQYIVGLYGLAVMFACGVIFAGFSLYPRTYPHLGVTPADLNVAAWEPLLKGCSKHALELCGVRIKEYARRIIEHDRSNAKKSRWLKFAVIAIVLSFPIAIGLAAATSVFVFLHSP
jgi:hypothetical protein